MNINFNVKSVVEYSRLRKRGITVEYLNRSGKTLTLEVRVEPERKKSDINLLEELAVIICGGMSDFDNYKEFNNLEVVTKLDMNEYKRQSDLFKRIENFFLYEEPDKSKHSYAIDFAKKYFDDFLYDSTDSYFEHSRNLY